MGKVTLISEFKRQKETQMEAGAVCARVHRQTGLQMDDLFVKDYSSLKDIVYGIVKVREILTEELGLDFEWQHQLLCLLTDAYEFCKDSSNRFGDSITYLQCYIEERLDKQNESALGTALVILRLIEKSYLYKKMLTQ